MIVIAYGLALAWLFGRYPGRWIYKTFFQYPE